MQHTSNETSTLSRGATDFPYKSLRQTMSMLDCSKFYLYKLIKKKVLQPHYFENDEEGNSIGKPYFKVEEIAGALHPKSSEK